MVKVAVQGDKGAEVSHATACSNASLSSVDKASRSTLPSKYHLIYKFLSVFSSGRVFPIHQQAYGNSGYWLHSAMVPWACPGAPCALYSVEKAE